jgi:hypothetical protein
VNDKGSETSANATRAEGEIIPPSVNGDQSNVPNVYAEIAAQITQYTDRPDLLLEVVEKHDPGFIKSMNDEARAFSKKTRNSRFNFGRTQAYVSLAVQVAAALVILAALYQFVTGESVGFLPIVGLGIVFAITQSGIGGFMKIVNQIVAIIRGGPPPNKDQ